MKATSSLLYELPTYDDVKIDSFRLSIVVPVYNEHHIVEASLRRVLALEHASDEKEAMRNIWSALETGGRVIVLAPQHLSLYGTLDEALERLKRYTAAEVEQSLAHAGFSVEKMFDFNRVSVPGWWLKSKLLRSKKFSRVQLIALNVMIPIFKRIDRLWPWSGLSVIGIGVKE